MELNKEGKRRRKRYLGFRVWVEGLQEVGQELG